VDGELDRLKIIYFFTRGDDMIYSSRRVEDWASEILAISAFGGEEMILPKKANLAMVNTCQGPNYHLNFRYWMTSLTTCD
jgi:hypothetical protein